VGFPVIFLSIDWERVIAAVPTKPAIKPLPRAAPNAPSGFDSFEGIFMNNLFNQIECIKRKRVTKS
jgi:hypothetical protein